MMNKTKYPKFEYEEEEKLIKINKPKPKETNN